MQDEPLGDGARLKAREERQEHDPPLQSRSPRATWLWVAAMLALCIALWTAYWHGGAPRASGGSASPAALAHPP